MSSDWPGIDDGRVSEHQAEKLLAATTGRIGILAGSPGTGKTFSAAALVKAIIAEHGAMSIAIAAPTGKAAVRITEAMAGYGIEKRATTIHSLLGVAAKKRGDGWTFKHDADNPLPHQYIVVDESSMIDTGLMASLLSARAKGSHILFVGDPNQLPPVGHGAPLRDMIAANAPYGELREIRRNSGTIVRACAQIRDGKPFGVDAAIDLAAEPPKNLKVVAASGAEQQIKKMLLAIQCAKADGRDPIWDCQVIVPVNAKSELSRRAINKILQQELNWQGKVAGGNPFKVGDKIVCLKNSFMPADRERCSQEALSMADGDGKLFVANGELAAVVDVAEKLTMARLSSPERFIKIPRGNQKDGGDEEGEGGGDENGEENKSTTGCQWDLGYALSFHKSQGSEWPVVILLADDYPGARRLYSRELWYTGISRAKCLCLIVGNYSTVQGGCRVQALYKRRTFLKELIFEKAAGQSKKEDRTSTLNGTEAAAHASL